ncbi:MAG: helix-turn-helix transcriptional regulator [Clostridia bacterium]|nr:helix-turn-helix transcriptional regulator [Clostridia bacterium]
MLKKHKGIAKWKKNLKISHNISWLRKKNGITKKQMAALLGISVRSLSKIEKGETCRKLNLTTIFDIMCIFNISANDLFNIRLEDI